MTDVSGTGIEAVPYVPKTRVLVLRLYGTYQHVGTGIEVVTKQTGVFGKVLRLNGNTSARRKPSYSYRWVGYGYRGRMELTELSGASSWFVLNHTGVFGGIAAVSNLTRDFGRVSTEINRRCAFVRTQPITPLGKL